MVILTEECSSMVMRKNPKKLKDLGNFSLTIETRNSDIVHALSDMGKIKNQIPLLLLSTLSLGSRGHALCGTPNGE